MADSIDTTGRALVDHWNWAADKGLMKSASASALRAACTQVLGIDENWETVDVRTIDVEDYFNRFVNKRNKDFKPDSLEAYKRRFSQAVKSFLDYTNDPSSWKPKQKDPAKPKKTNGNAENIEVEDDVEETPRQRVPAGAVDYPFPLGKGRMATLRLPTDLRAAEAKRLAAFVSTLAFDDADVDDETS